MIANNGAEFTKNINKKQQANILDLAMELAYNYYSNSFGDEFNLTVTRSREIFKGGNDDKIIKDFSARMERKERVRNVLIVGAGASHDSYKAFHTGFHLREEVKQLYEEKI